MEEKVFTPNKEGDTIDLISNLASYFSSVDWEKRRSPLLKNELTRVKTRKEKTYVDKLRVRLVDKDYVYKEILKEVIPVFNSIKAALGALAGKISIAYDNQKQVHLIVHDELNKIYLQLENQLNSIKEDSEETKPEDYEVYNGSQLSYMLGK